MSSEEGVEKELERRTRDILTSIQSGDIEAYRSLVADDVTCFEPEACGHLVKGLPFHEFYFHRTNEKKGEGPPVNNTVAECNVRVIGNCGIVTYVRLIQTVDETGKLVTVPWNETRVFEKREGEWMCVHFHRS